MMVADLVVVGVGGHGREVAAAAAAAIAAGAQWRLLGFVDDRAELTGSEINGLPVLGTIDWLLARSPIRDVVLGIGLPAPRFRAYQRLRSGGLRFPSLRHPSALIGQSVTVSDGVYVAAGAVVTENVLLSAHAHINIGASVSHDGVLGAFTSVAPGARLLGNVRTGDGVDIGGGAVVLPGRSIGRWAVVGAGAVVTRDVAPTVVVAGVPASVRRTVDWFPPADD